MTYRIRTDRLLLRPFETDDAVSVRDICNDDGIARYMLQIPHPFGLDDAEEFLGRVTGKVGDVWAVVYR